MTEAEKAAARKQAFAYFRELFETPAATYQLVYESQTVSSEQPESEEAFYDGSLAGMSVRKRQ